MWSRSSVKQGGRRSDGGSNAAAQPTCMCAVGLSTSRNDASSGVSLVEDIALQSEAPAWSRERDRQRFPRRLPFPAGHLIGCVRVCPATVAALERATLPACGATRAGFPGG